MVLKTKHYTSVEKKIFLDILKDFKDVIESKKSDSSTLREKADAWIEIARIYNISLQIDGERTVAQLKKLWTNLKQGQRNALTEEKQASMATGGGPQAPPAVIDPDISIIAPHLMQQAPSNFSSNIVEDHRNDYLREMVEQEDNDDGVIEYLDETLLEEADVAKVNVQERQLPGTSSSSSQAIDLETSKQVRKKLCVAGKRNRTCTESSVQQSSTDRIKEDTLKMQRVAGLCQNDEELFLIKKAHEIKVAKMTECHLNVMNRIREEHLIKIHDLEIRKATAEADLAEMKLSRERDNV